MSIFIESFHQILTLLDKLDGFAILKSFQCPSSFFIFIFNAPKLSDKHRNLNLNFNGFFSQTRGSYEGIKR
jgi:hypothetical protein